MKAKSTLLHSSLLLFTFSFPVAAFAGEEYPELPRKITRETAEEKASRMQWWTDARFGMFIHFGLYAVPSRHEWVQNFEAIATDDYEKRYFPRFNPDLYDAKKWVATAKQAGMKYMVLTAKHHEGFCMWDTATTDFKITKTARRDILKELADCCARRGMGLGLYYSNPDWNFPHGYNAASSHQVRPEPGDEPDVEKLKAYEKTQITELLTNYGAIVCFFWDIPTNVRAPEMNALVRRLQPGILINDRGWEMGYGTGDYTTPERGFNDGGAFTNLTEACDSTGAQSWGFRRHEDYRTVGYLTRAVDGYLACGGNFLLNVGPRADGTIPEQARAALAGVGRWLAKVRPALRDVETAKGTVADRECVVTRRGNRLFAHYPFGLSASGVDLGPIERTPTSVRLLNTGEPLPFAVERLPSNFTTDPTDRAPLPIKPTLHVWDIPADALANECAVIELAFGN